MKWMLVLLALCLSLFAHRLIDFFEGKTTYRDLVKKLATSRVMKE